MSRAMTVSGTRVAVSPNVPVNYNLDDEAALATAYNALTGFEDTGCDLTNVGDLTRTWSEVTHTCVSNNMEDVDRGTFKWNSMNLELNRKFNSASQMIIEDAEDSGSLITVRVTLPDGMKIYFVALVMELPLQMGAGNDRVRTTVKLQPKSRRFIPVPA